MKPLASQSAPDLLRRFQRNVYPPSLSEDQQTTVKDYLAEKGYEAGVGVVSGESRLKTQYLVKLAVAEMPLRPDLIQHAVVGPHQYDEPGAISLYVPAVRPDSPDTKET